eukprot:gnl/MRDRNA2_/MRDRNA2_36459_c0_seq1.p1 gnl/MRDRNA2_/MRDRNA2_36459_c0~~gnl/MRDRNA2_/MRDRNA2_36459_c0_seq1.p1  ORF type:complete len:159 (+),score=16.49 gnl/MRDRNA2_/MRDRNA2_36459_c0_seq1:55-531(+)
MSKLSERQDFKSWLDHAPQSSRDALQALEGLVAADRCLIFSTTWCPWCSRAQKFVSSQLDQKCRKIHLDKPPKELADHSQQEVATVLSRVTGQKGLPNIFVSRKHVGGFDNLVQTVQKCRAGTLGTEHQDVCDFLDGGSRKNQLFWKMRQHLKTENMR